MNTAGSLTPELQKEYSSFIARDSLRSAKTACILVIVLMPIGYVLDYFVYPAFVWELFKLRLWTSGLAAVLLITLRQQGLSPLQYRILSAGWYIVPSFFISWMIAVTEGATSPYYAGLNLVILGVISVVQATFLESIVAVTLIVLMYLAACFLHSSLPNLKDLVNNAYFTFCTVAIVLTGNYFYNRLRFREFALRYELDANHQKLEESNQKLVELDQVKSRFFANISHELRTPLTLLIAPLESLLTRHQMALDVESRNLLLTMHANGMRLLKLINDLLDLVRLESGKMVVKRERVEMAHLIKGLASATRQVADDKRVTLETSCGSDVGTVMVDRDKLEKIILNLLFNALKFTPSGGKVELSAEKHQDELWMFVKDTGMGISQKNLPYIFDRFWQVDSSSQRKYQGAGIGLSLVKELVEIQGGTVSVESQEGACTTFTLRFPYLAAELAAPAIAPAPVLAGDSESSDNGAGDQWLSNLYRRAELFPAITPLQDTLRSVETLSQGGLPVLLVADDEPDMLRFLKSQLKGHYQVLEAVDGQQAVEKASQFLPDMILLDMMMPQKDGLAACRELREQTSTKSIPIILLTARADEETKLAALSAGASDFLAKPFSTTELHVRIKNLVESHHYQRSLGKQNQLLEETIEQLKETETQLVQTEKLASLGRMSAGIIHEINNPLNFATTGLFTLRNKSKLLAEDHRPEFVEILNDVEEGITRVKNIVLDLRTFTQPATDDIEEVAVNEVWAAALRFLSHEWKDKIEIVDHLPADFKIPGNKNRLIQVFVNLLQNALDALKIKTFDSEKPKIEICGRSAGGRSIVTIRDNGVGIDPKHIDKVFDPFFTTKDVGQGMGLGLSICYRIAQAYGGQIQVESELGQYCEVTMDFPTPLSNHTPAPS